MAAPVGVAQALPGLYTGAMYTARVGDALVTVLALPAIQTPARHTESHAVSLRGGTEKSLSLQNWDKTVFHRFDML